MPGLPRSRMARLLARRNDDDSVRAADALVVGAVAGLGFVAVDVPVLALVAVLVAVAGVAYFARRILRRQAVLTALGEDGVVVGSVGSEGGEHTSEVTESYEQREADR